MKKINKASKEKKLTGTNNTLEWKRRREMIINSIALEVDLENRQVFFEAGVEKKMRLEFGTNNVDNLIKTYLDDKDLKHVVHSLTEAKKGLEKPIQFQFVHPLTSKSYRFEYRYQIVYVKYSSTRLLGELHKCTPLRKQNRK
jgi:hypothetical protein